MQAECCAKDQNADSQVDGSEFEVNRLLAFCNNTKGKS